MGWDGIGRVGWLAGWLERVRDRVSTSHVLSHPIFSPRDRSLSAFPFSTLPTDCNGRSRSSGQELRQAFPRRRRHCCHCACYFTVGVSGSQGSGREGVEGGACERRVGRRWTDR